MIKLFVLFAYESIYGMNMYIHQHLFIKMKKLLFILKYVLPLKTELLLTIGFERLLAYKWDGIGTGYEHVVPFIAYLYSWTFKS